MAENPKKITRDDANKAFDAFKALTRKLVRVPKAELDKAEAEYQRKKAKRLKRRKSS
jgi:hypothetical protein